MGDMRLRYKAKGPWENRKLVSRVSSECEVVVHLVLLSLDWKKHEMRICK